MPSAQLLSVVNVSKCSGVSFRNAVVDIKRSAEAPYPEGADFDAFCSWMQSCKSARCETATTKRAYSIYVDDSEFCPSYFNFEDDDDSWSTDAESSFSDAWSEQCSASSSFAELSEDDESETPPMPALRPHIGLRLKTIVEVEEPVDYEEEGEAIIAAAKPLSMDDELILLLTSLPVIRRTTRSQ